MGEFAAGSSFHPPERHLEELASRLKGAGLPGPLETALIAPLQRRQAVRSVGELVRLAERERRTLWQQWNHVRAGAEEITLKDYVNWTLLLRAAAVRARGEPWAEAARRMEIHPRRLRRISKRTLGRSLEELEEMEAGFPELLEIFRIRVLEPLVRG